MTSSPDPHPASAAAQVGATTYVSSVLPWRGCGSRHPWVGDRHVDKTKHAVDDLLAAPPRCRLARLGRRLEPRPGRAPSTPDRRAVAARSHGPSTSWRLVVPTAELPHPIEGLLSIDHIAVPEGIAAKARRVAATHEGKRLSDHDAYVVDTDL